MSKFQAPRTLSFKAEADLSSKKYHAVKLGTNAGEVNAAAAGEGIGILMNDPELGCYAEVAMLGGGAMGHSGAAIAKGAELAADADGKLITAVAGNIVLGIALEAVAGADTYFEMERVYYVKA